MYSTKVYGTAILTQPSCHSYDVVFTAGKAAILDNFDSFDSRVVFGAEDYCWPKKDLASQYPRVSFGYKYLNSGGKIMP